MAGEPDPLYSIRPHIIHDPTGVRMSVHGKVLFNVSMEISHTRLSVNTPLHRGRIRLVGKNTIEFKGEVEKKKANSTLDSWTFRNISSVII